MTENPIAELINLHHNHGHAMIGGVEFDFRHAEIDDRWIPSREIGWSGSLPRFPRNGAPRWIFPWTEITNDAGLATLAKLRGRAFLREIVLLGPDGCVGPGDKVFISSVKQARIGSQFEAEPDALVLRVSYSVRRPDERTERLRGRSIYLHWDRDWGERMGRIGGQSFHDGLGLAAVERRVRALMRPGDLNEDGTTTEKCEANAANCWSALAELDRPETRGMWRERALVRAGYFLAKAEARSVMGPFAERGLAAVEGGAEGGRRSGEARRRKAVETLEPHALELALAQRAKEPAISQDDLAAEVLNGWKLASAVPGMSWLRGFVRRAETDGRLPRRDSSRSPKSARR